MAKILSFALAERLLLLTMTLDHCTTIFLRHFSLVLD